MDNNQILVFQTKTIIKPPKGIEVVFHNWSPSLINFVPEGKPLKYMVNWFFLYLGVFKNKNYAAYNVKEEGRIISGFLVLPGYFRWPFMKKNSVQFTYVLTDSTHRGKGLAWRGIYQAYIRLKAKGVSDFWYVTDEKNIASQKLARKMGFSLVGIAKEEKAFLGILKKLCLDETK